MRDKAVPIAPFTDEQLRIIINLEQHYEVWSEADRALSLLPYGFKWKSVNGREYLYEMHDRTGNGKSHGPRSEETEHLYRNYRAKKEELAERRNRSSAMLNQTCRLYRALRLPLLSVEAAKLLREADRRSLLGTHLMVVGANVMIAYALEMSGWIGSTFDRTDTLDLALLKEKELNSRDTPVWPMLKAVDHTYTVDLESLFQACNAKGHMVRVVAAPSRATVRADKPVPARMREQKWLLLGKRVSRVVVARDGSPARVVAPDPRWYALLSLWLADHGRNDPEVRSKHRERGTALLAGIQRFLPAYSLSDPEFLKLMPSDLRPLYDRYASVYQDAPLPDW